MATLDAAFGELIALVKKRLESGRSTRSAGIKPALQAISWPPFDEGPLGFETFREFLREAERRQLIRLVAVPGVPDVDVLLPEGEDIPAPSSVSRRRLRQDLWNAFVRWDDGTRRAWDVEAGQVVEHPASDPGPLSQAPERFIAITPIDRSAVLEWMAALADAVPAHRDELRGALGESEPLSSFVATAKRLNLLGKWRHHQLDQVRSIIEDWASAHSLEIILWDTSGVPTTKRRPAEVGGRRGTTDEARLRADVHRLVDGMTLPELLAIPVPMRLLHVQ